MKILISITITLLFVSLGKAQETNQGLTIHDVIRIAREQSPDAILAKHRFKSSYWQYRAFKASRLPSVSMDAEALNYNNSINNILQDDGSYEYWPSQNNTSGVGLNINQKVAATGGQFFIRTGLERSDNFLADSLGTSFKSVPFTIGYSQPAFQYNQHKWEKKIEPLVFDEAKKKYLHQLETISEKAIIFFYNLATANLNVEIAKTNFHNNDTLYKIAKGRYQMGTIAENELLQLELAYLNAKSDLAQSKINQQADLFRLRSFLGYNELARITLNTHAQIPTLEIPLDQAFSQANKNNSELIAQTRRLLEVQRDLAKAKADNRFNANLYASYGLNQNAYNVPDAYLSPGSDQQIRIGIRIPILDWGEGKGRFKMAQSNQEVVRSQVDQARTDFKQDIMLKVLQFNEQNNQVNIAAKADTIAQKRYEVAKQRFLIGKISVLELNTASTEKDVALRNNLQAQRTFWSYLYTIRQFTLYDFLTNQPISADFDKIKN